MNDQEKFWGASFGDEYQERNAQAEVGGVQSNEVLFRRILSKTQDVQSIIEFGAGIGNNLRAIHNISPEIELSAVEINRQAANEIPEYVKTVIVCAILDLPTIHAQDMAFTKGVLIHVPPMYLSQAYAALYNASRRYIMVAEYFTPQPRMIPYRGHDDRLWSRDFAGELLTAYSDLELVDYGFVSRRDQFPQDDITWFLLEKK